MDSQLLRNPEAHAAAAELDLVLEDKPQLLAVVQDMLRPESLPPGWSVNFDEPKGRREYTHGPTEEIQYEHPNVSYYKGAVFMECGGNNELLQREQQQPPHEQEVLDMCNYFRVAPDEDAYVREVAVMAINAPMPEGWVEVEDAQGNLVFKNDDRDEVQAMHPLDPYFVEVIARRRQELQNPDAAVALRAAAAQQHLEALLSGKRQLMSLQGQQTLQQVLPGAQEQLPGPPAGGAASTSGPLAASDESTKQTGAAAAGSVPELHAGSSKLQGAFSVASSSYSSTSIARQHPGLLAGGAAENSQQLRLPNTDGTASNSQQPVAAGASSTGSTWQQPEPVTYEGSNTGEIATLQDWAQVRAAAAEARQALQGSSRQSTARLTAAADAGDHAATDHHNFTNPTNLTFALEPVIAAADTSVQDASSTDVPTATTQPLQQTATHPSAQIPGSSSVSPAAQQENSNADLNAEEPTMRTSPDTQLLQQQPATAPLQPYSEPAAVAGSSNPSRNATHKATHSPNPSLKPQRPRCRTPFRSPPPCSPPHSPPPRSPPRSRSCSHSPSLYPAGDTNTVPSRIPGLPRQAEPSGIIPLPSAPSRPASSLFRSKSFSEVYLAAQGELSEDGATAVSRDSAIQAARAGTKERIQVALRVRPVANPSEIYAWVIDPNMPMVTLKEGMPLKAAASRMFQFDRVFGPATGTQELFQQHVQPLLDSTLQGVNCTVFAYGQTGSGKTHTIFGSRLEDGTLGLSISHLFNSVHSNNISKDPIKARSGGFGIKLSMLELYNEQLRDLLVSSSDRLTHGSPTLLQLVDDARLGVRVQGLTEQPIYSLEEAMGLIQFGHSQRSVGSTALNEVSSRSHTIVRLHIESLEPALQDGKCTAIASIVDLAGSERMSKTGSTGLRFTEGLNINVSLLMLGTVVARLAEGRRGDFIPYRNSKLTRLLQPCLGGNARTALVAVINPGHHHIEETLNTLAFAQRAMAVVQQVTVNKERRGGDGGGALVAELRQQIAALQAQLQASDQGHGVSDLHTRVLELQADKARLLDQLEGLTGQPAGDVSDDITPAAPPDLRLPAVRPSKLAINATPEKALRSIARIAFLGAAAAGAAGAGVAGAGKGLGGRQAGAGDGSAAAPEEVVMMVRQMRAERDELRRRDAKWRGQLAAAQQQLVQLQPLVAEHETVVECAQTLENLLGEVSTYGDGPLPAAERLKEAVAAVAMLSNELNYLQRQYHTAAALAQAAEARAAVLETQLHAWQQLQLQQDGSDSRKAAAGVEQAQLTTSLTAQLQAAQADCAAVKAELDKWRGMSGGHPGGDSQAEAGAFAGGGIIAGSYAIKVARMAQAEAKALERALKLVESERCELQEKLTQLEAMTGLSSPDHPALGGAATAAGSRADGLQLDDAIAGSEGNAAGFGQPQLQLDGMKQKVASLTREMAALVKERDSLLALVMQSAQAPTGTSSILPNQIINRVFSSVPAKQGLNPLPLDNLLGPARSNQPHGSLLGGSYRQQHHHHLIAAWPEAGGAGPAATSSAPASIGMSSPASSKAGGKQVAVAASAEGQPAFNLRDTPAEIRVRLQRQNDRHRMHAVTDGGSLQGSGSTNPGALGGYPSSGKEAESLQLRRKVVQLEKARAELLAKAAADSRAAQLQLNSVTRQAQAAAKAANDRLRAFQVEKEQELSSFKSEASAVITALMEENTRLKSALSSQWGAPSAPGGVPQRAVRPGRRTVL